MREELQELPRGTKVEVSGKGTCLYLQSVKGSKKTMVEVILDKGAGKLTTVPRDTVTIPEGHKI